MNGLNKEVIGNKSHDLSPLEIRHTQEWVNNGELYWATPENDPKGSPDNPKEGDVILKIESGVLNGYRYESGVWVDKSSLINDSIYTDRFIAIGLLRGFYTDGEDSLIRKALTFLKTIIVGDLDNKLVLYSAGDIEFAKTDGTIQESVPQPFFDEEKTTDQMEFFTDPFNDEKIIKEIFKMSHATETTTHMRWTAHTAPERTDESLVYESVSQYDYDADSDSSLLDITTGVFDISKPLQLNDMLGDRMYYTIYTKVPITYLGHTFDVGTVDEQFLPYFNQFDYNGQPREIITTQEWVNERLNYKRCSLSKSIDQPVSAGVWTSITFDIEKYDVGGWHNGVNPTRQTVPVTGLYELKYNVKHESMDKTSYESRVLLNGTDPVEGACDVMVGSKDSSFGTLSGFSDVLSLEAGDYLELQYKHDDGTSQDVMNSNTFFAIRGVC